MARNSRLARPVRQVRQTAQDTRAHGLKQDGSLATGPAQRPKPLPTATVLKAALAEPGLDSRAQAALDKYRAALQALGNLTLDSAEGAMAAATHALHTATRELEELPLPASLGAAVAILQELFQDCADVIFRSVLIGGRRPALVLMVDGVVNAERLEQNVLQPLVHWGEPDQVPSTAGALKVWLESVAVSVQQVEPVYRVGQVVDAVLNAGAVALVDGVAAGVRLAVGEWKQRSIEEPVAEGTIRGPREGFNEILQTNISLLRRKLRSPHLKIEQLTLGRVSRTPVSLVYLQDIVNPGLVAEVRRRLQRIDTDAIIDTGMIEEFIEDQPLSLFPQIGNTERPDRVVAGLLEGRVAILADGTPFGLLVPVTFWSQMQAGEDYYERFWVNTAVRWLRYQFMIIALVGPSAYVAITTFHQEMLPTNLLLSIAAAREGIPFPALVEALIMEIFFEALREAGVRLPRPIGQAVSIVGALVIGEAAVRAGLASAPVVIIVGITGIASFTFPRFNLGIAIRLARFPLMVLAGSLGLFGLMVGLLGILVHLCALRSFGTPFLQPLAPLTWTELKDVLVRAPVWKMKYRQRGLQAINRRRQAPGLEPEPRGNGS